MSLHLPCGINRKCLCWIGIHFFLSTCYIYSSSWMWAMTEEKYLHRWNHLAVREMLMSGQAPVLYPAKDKHNSDALPGLSFLVRWKTKTSEVNLVHIFVWNQICSCYLTLVHWFCLSDSPIGGKLDVFHWLSSCKEKSISEHPAAAGPLLTYQMGHWRRNWPHLFLMSP